MQNITDEALARYGPDSQALATSALWGRQAAELQYNQIQQLHFPKIVLQDLLPDGFAMGVVSRARDLGCLVGVVGDLKYVSSIAEGRASGEDWIIYETFSRGSVLHGAGWRPTIPALLDIEVKEVYAQAQEEKLRCSLLQAI